MTLKLNGSSSGSVSIDAPASTTDGADLAYTLPNATTGGVIRTTTTPGAILQVLSTKSTAVDFNTDGTSMVEYPALNTAITPSHADNKVLIMVCLCFGAQAAGNFGFSLYDGSSAISDSINSNVTTNTSVSFQIPNSYTPLQVNFNYLWSPNTTSEKTVKVYVQGDGSGKTLYLNRYGGSAGRGGQSSMTLMEVAG